VYTDVYVSRYWTKVAPSVLDATRSDISPGTGFFVTRGRNYETGHFSRAAAGCRNTKSALPLPRHLSFLLSLSLSLASSPLFPLPRQRNIWTLYALRAIGLRIGLIDASSTAKCDRRTCVFISLTGTFVSNVKCFISALSNLEQSEILINIKYSLLFQRSRWMIIFYVIFYMNRIYKYIESFIFALA